MNKITDRKKVRAYSLLFMTVYLISYITRINYGAVISEMVRDTGLSKAALSLALTGSFISYGIGQVVSGKLGDKFQPKNLIAAGLSVTVFMNLLIPVCTSPYQMLAVWSINGASQSFLWPPLVRLMTTVFTPEDYSKACVMTSWGSAGGTILIYLTTPLFITLWGWKSVFLISAACGIIMIAVWMKFCCKIEPQSENNEKSTDKKGKSVFHILFMPVMLWIMLAIIIQGALRDGITTWMPSYISETYNLSTEIAILTNVILPLFSIICFQIAEFLYRKIFKNPLICAGVIFGIGAASAIFMVIFSGSSAVLSIICSAVLTGCMHGVNLILICMLPTFFYKYGIVSTASGILNSCTYIGSAISTYTTAVLSETFGWNTALYIWIASAVLGTAVCLMCAKPWNRFAKS